MNDMTRLNRMQESLFEVQGEVAAGQRIEFHIPLDLIGVSIGKGGQRIKDVTARTNVHNISINGKSGLVEISGPSPSSVQAARELMDVVQADVALSKDEAISMLKDNR
jgi:polyribonucleotide nucleotidyltransferase